MTDLTTMPPLDAIEWYEKHRDAVMWDTDDLRWVVGAGITDTTAIIQILDGDLNSKALRDGRIPLTVDNVRLLGKVGERVMLEDPDNASEWYTVLGEDRERDDAEAFLDAGRGPTFARDILAALDRQDMYGVMAVDKFDLSRPKAVLISMIDAELTEHEVSRWQRVGVYTIPDMLAIRDKVGVGVAEALHRDRIPREKWADYSNIPGRWLDRTRPVPFTVDVLKEFADAKYALDSSGPWHVPIGRYATAGVSVDAARMIRDAGMQPADPGRYWGEVNVRGVSVPGAPPHLAADDFDRLLPTFAKLWQAGVRASHLTDYRWGGCHSYEQILDAVAEGITPGRVKELRKRHGKNVGYSTRPKLRIMDYASLLTYHRADDRSAPKEGVSA